jgi:hypothetical protein
MTSVVRTPALMPCSLIESKITAAMINPLKSYDIKVYDSGVRVSRKFKPLRFIAFYLLEGEQALIEMLK